MAQNSKKNLASTELTSGGGFTYEDTVVAYYLVKLLRHEAAIGQDGIVTSVAVQRKGHGHPMDDVIVEFDDAGSKKSLDIQVKSSIIISGANKEFSGIIQSAYETRSSANFDAANHRCGFIVGHVSDAKFRSLERVIDKAKSSPDAKDFKDYFSDLGTAGVEDKTTRAALLPRVGSGDLESEVGFYRGFVAIKMSDLGPTGALRVELVNRLQELVSGDQQGQGALLFDRICRIAREGGAHATKWNRNSLIAQLRNKVRLKVAPQFEEDVTRIHIEALNALKDISETIGKFHVARDELIAKVADALNQHRLVSIVGLPGTGKSALLKQIAGEAGKAGPVLVLKNDRLSGTNWSTFASAHSVRNTDVGSLLAEIGISGTPILFIDGVDRIRPDQQNIISDLIHAIEIDPHLRHWKVIATSRDQGLEAFRAWFPESFYAENGMGSITVGEFSDEEAEQLAKSQPVLQNILFNSSYAVQQIARRPFFASVLSKSIPKQIELNSEIALIDAWWVRAGYDAPKQELIKRQRALIDLAEQGVRNLGKDIPARSLKPQTIDQVPSLIVDDILRSERSDAFFSFTHDVFFEWVFFRLLIELDDDWPSAIAAGGEPPLLGRIVSLLSQDALTKPGRWTAELAKLENANLRAQWRREWLTAALFASEFENALNEFTETVKANDFALFEKLVVWFQAQHTVPSPSVMAMPFDISATNKVRMADLFAWPSDGLAWGRLIDWIVSNRSILPTRLVPYSLEILKVWQNACAGYKNQRSERILSLCNTWLIDLETEIYSQEFPRPREKWNGLSDEAQKSLASELRTMILTAASTYPAFAIELFERAAASKQILRPAFSDLMAFTWIMAEVAPDMVAKVVEAKLIRELPQELNDRLRKEEREAAEYRAQIQKIPADQRTRSQEMSLSSPRIPHSFYDFKWEDIGLDRDTFYFHPPSGFQEPFASLLQKSPQLGLRLIKKITNHATLGWRQIHKFCERTDGTPIPVVLDFPWGRQEFWGDWHVFGWGLGWLGSEVLQTAYLNLSLWAFKEIENGRPTGEVIREILVGSECYGTLGLCLRLALETFEISDITLPIVTCQRLWEHDLSRRVQEPSKDMDILGLGLPRPLTGEKAKAKLFLDTRLYHKHDVRELAMRFAICGDQKLRENFKEKMALFPIELPFEIEEDRNDLAYSQKLKDQAKVWAGLGDIQNYKRYQIEHNQVAIGYEPESPLPEALQKQATQSEESLTQMWALNWAQKYLESGSPSDGWTLASAIEFARRHDRPDLFATRADVGPHCVQSCVSAVAASIVRFGSNEPTDLSWAWDVMDRASEMVEPNDVFGSRIPWHPALHVISALFHDRKTSLPKPKSTLKLLKLANHPNEGVQTTAFEALFFDPDLHVQWVAAHYALALSHYSIPTWDEETFRRSNRRQQDAANAALSSAINSLNRSAVLDFAALPPAWVKVPSRTKDGEDNWVHPNVCFDAQRAAKLFKLLPIEGFCQSDEYCTKFRRLLEELLAWTRERHMPSWLVDRARRDRDTQLFKWDDTLGQLLARAIPFFDIDWFQKHCLTPFSKGKDEGLRILEPLATNIVTRYIFDAKVIPENAFEVLNDCVDRVIRDRTFDKESYRAGEVSGYNLPDLIRSLQFVCINKDCPGAARFVNGDWREIEIIMPLVTKLMKGAGWSTFVMENYLTLCERVRTNYPIDAFIEQATVALASIEYARGSWVGTNLPARLAGVVQQLATTNYPLNDRQAQGLLNLLDALIDLGDRRSAALEQDEAFRRVQII